MVQEKKEGKLTRLLKAAEKTIAKLKAKIVELTRELDQYRSVRGQFQGFLLEKENKELKQKNSLYRSIIESNGLSHLLERQQGALRQERRDIGNGRCGQLERLLGAVRDNHTTHPKTEAAKPHEYRLYERLKRDIPAIESKGLRLVLNPLITWQRRRLVNRRKVW